MDKIAPAKLKAGEKVIALTLTTLSASTPLVIVILIYVTLSDRRERRVSFLVNRLSLSNNEILRLRYAPAQNDKLSSSP